MEPYDYVKLNVNRSLEVVVETIDASARQRTSLKAVGRSKHRKTRHHLLELHRNVDHMAMSHSE